VFAIITWFITGIFTVISTIGGFSGIGSYKNNSFIDFNNINNLVVLIEFADGPYYTTDDLKGAEGAYNVVNAYDKTTSLKEYLEEVSYNKLKINTSFYPKTSENSQEVKPYRSRHNKSYYLKYSKDNTQGYQTPAEGIERVGEMLKAAVEQIENQISKELELDNNDDGIIDAVTFIYNYKTFDVVDYDNYTEYPIDWEDALWPQWWSSYMVKANMGSTPTIRDLEINSLSLLGSSFYNYELFNSKKQNTGIMIHEFMHILGFPDLYREDSEDPEEACVGSYDIMETTQYEYPQNILAYYQREFAGWGAPIEEIIQTTDGITINKADHINPEEKIAVKIKSPSNEDEYFVVEYRKKEGLDKGLDDMKSDGIIVYRINEAYDVSVGNQFSTRDNRDDFIYVFRPNETYENSGNGDLSKATLSLESGRNSLGIPLQKSEFGFDNNTLYFSDGSNSGIEIYNVGSNKGDSITFSVKIPN